MFSGVLDALSNVGSNLTTTMTAFTPTAVTGAIVQTAQQQIQDAAANVTQADIAAAQKELDAFTSSPTSSGQVVSLNLPQGSASIPMSAIKAFLSNASKMLNEADFEKVKQLVVTGDPEKYKQALAIYQNALMSIQAKYAASVPAPAILSESPWGAPKPKLAPVPVPPPATQVPIWNKQPILPKPEPSVLVNTPPAVQEDTPPIAAAAAFSVPNWAILGAVAVGAYLLMRKK